jgi:hypothetical protein
MLIRMGKKTSVWLSDDLVAGWRASRLPLAELVRRGLELGAPGRPVDEVTHEAILRRVLREELAGLPVADGRAQGGYGARDFEYEREAYLQDP